MLSHWKIFTAVLLFSWASPLWGQLAMNPIRVHTGSSNASTALAIDGDFMAVGDDEDQTLRIYPRRFDGPPFYKKDFTDDLGLADLGINGKPKEVDIEASTRIGSRVYWLGSHGNCGGCETIGALRTNRHRLFATDLLGLGGNTRLLYAGRYDRLRLDLIAWDNTNGHGRGPQFYRLAASAADGVSPEAPDGSGFNIEGLTMSSDGSAAYLGFRSPLTPQSGRTNALIIPLLNLPELVMGNPAPGPARFGQPIELFLDGQGIRGLESDANGVVILAGPVGTNGSNRLYTWSGQRGDPVRERRVDVTVPEPEGMILDGPLAEGTRLQLISEGASTSMSESVVIGPGLPEILSLTRVAPHAMIVSIRGRSNAFYDLERSDDGGSWTFLERIPIRPTGEASWTNANVPPHLRQRLYRLRYPSFQ